MSAASKEGLAALRFPLLVLAAGIGVSVFLVVGSYLYWQAEKKTGTTSAAAVSDLQGRLAAAKRERDDLRNSEATFQALTARGVFVAERRLDLVDALETLKTRHKLISLEYNVLPQRILTLAAGSSVSAVEPLGSRVKLRARAVHDRDLLSFLDNVSQLQRGMFPIQRCTLQFPREGSSAGGVGGAGGVLGVAAAGLQGLATRSEPSLAALAAGGEASSVSATARPTLEASCELEWITLRDKSIPVDPASATKPLQAMAGTNR
jgi:hypothetical protein